MTSTMLFAFALARFYQEIFADLLIWFIEIASWQLFALPTFLFYKTADQVMSGSLGNETLL